MTFVAIVGSRNYKALHKVDEYVDSLPEDTIVVSGGARGVDSRAEKRARERGLRVVTYLPEWDRYGKRAGFVRNADIVDRAHKVVAFWDGESKGTYHTIKLAWQAGKPVEIHPDGTDPLP